MPPLRRRGSQTSHRKKEMKIKYKLGDLMTHSGRFLLHGCNAQGKMNSGVAKVIRTAYPLAWQLYSERHEVKPLILGEIIVADCGRHVVFNAITQDKYGYDGALYVDYDAIEAAMYAADMLMVKHAQDISQSEYAFDHQFTDTPGMVQIAMPLLGADRGGGDWKRIAAIIEERSVHFEPVVYIQEPEKLEKILKLVD